MVNKRMITALITGAILGIFCVIGAYIRYSGQLTNMYIFGFWFNRLLMGFVFGLLISPTTWKMRILRGISLGLLVSFAFYSATEFLDFTGFAIGALYGIIIESAIFIVEQK
jgi:hypothetical protein